MNVLVSVFYKSEGRAYTFPIENILENNKGTVDRASKLYYKPGYQL